MSAPGTPGGAGAPPGGPPAAAAPGGHGQLIPAYRLIRIPIVEGRRRRIPKAVRDRLREIYRRYGGVGPVDMGHSYGGEWSRKRPGDVSLIGAEPRSENRGRAAADARRANAAIRANPELAKLIHVNPVDASRRRGGGGRRAKAPGPTAGPSGGRGGGGGGGVPMRASAPGLSGLGAPGGGNAAAVIADLLMPAAQRLVAAATGMDPEARVEMSGAFRVTPEQADAARRARDRREFVESRSRALGIAPDEVERRLAAAVGVGGPRRPPQWTAPGASRARAGTAPPAGPPANPLAGMRVEQLPRTGARPPASPPATARPSTPRAPSARAAAAPRRAAGAPARAPATRPVPGRPASQPRSALASRPPAPPRRHSARDMARLAASPQPGLAAAELVARRAGGGRRSAPAVAAGGPAPGLASPRRRTPAPGASPPRGGPGPAGGPPTHGNVLRSARPPLSSRPALSPADRARVAASADPLRAALGLRSRAARGATGVGATAGGFTGGGALAGGFGGGGPSGQPLRPRPIGAGARAPRPAGGPRPRPMR